jgi:lysophospholipase L1-like esterase
MRAMASACGVMSAWILAAGGPAGIQEGKDLLPRARRIVFLGDSITYGGAYVAFFDAWLTASSPRDRHEVLNLGLPSETVSGLSEEGHAGGKFPRPDLKERLARVLAGTKPDLVVACYGMNCGIYLPLEEERFRKYKEGIGRLEKAVREAGARIVFVTPPTFDGPRFKPPLPDYDRVLGAYGEWLLSKRAEGWAVIDLHGPMAAEIASRREKDPAFTFQRDGVHPDERGHWFMAQQLIRYFGGPEAARAESPKAMMEDLPGGPGLLDPVRKRLDVLRDAWLTQTGHTRPGIGKGLPLEQAEAKARELTETIRKAVEGKGP